MDARKIYFFQQSKTGPKPTAFSLIVLPENRRPQTYKEFYTAKSLILNPIYVGSVNFWMEIFTLKPL